MPNLCLRIFIFSYMVLFIHAVEVPLGVNPSNAPFYVVGKPFTCLDKSATIPWSKVNDDYCDCLDGSDEPGTSACPDTEFYCSESLNVSISVRSGYVNDGFCDCCDGSDENDGHVKCNNTCEALAREKEEALEEKRKNVEIGYKIYKDYVSTKAIDLEHPAEVQERQRGDEEEGKSEQAEEKLSKQPEFETTPELPSPSSVDKFEEDADRLVSPDVESTEVEDAKIDHSDEPEETQEEDFARPIKESYVPLPPKPIDYGPENGFMMLTEPSIGCLELEDKDYVYSLCAFREVRQRPLGISGGSGTLLGTWKEWIGHPETSIDWTKEEKLEKLPYNEMLYDHGEHCWNGPTRSVKVRVACGAENKLLSVEEPSRCTYVMKLETPAACHHDPAKLIQIHTEL